MVVRKLDMPHKPVTQPELLRKSSVVGNPAEHHSHLRIQIAAVPLRKHRLGSIVPGTGKEKILFPAIVAPDSAGFLLIVSFYAHGNRPLVLFPGGQFPRTLCDDQHIRIRNPLRQIPQVAQRQQHIPGHRPVVVHQHYAQVRLEVPVLKTVIQNGN